MSSPWPERKENGLRKAITSAPLIGPKVAIGGRNGFLTGSGKGHALRLAAYYGSDFEALLRKLRWINQNHFEEALPDADLVRKAKWAFDKTLNGQNGFHTKLYGHKMRVPSNLNDILPRNAVGRMSLALIVELIQLHYSHHTFCLRPVFINKVLGRSTDNKKGLAEIKRILIAAQLIRQVSAPVKGSKPAYYGFGQVFITEREQRDLNI